MRILLLILLPPLLLVSVAIITVWALAIGAGSASCAVSTGTVLAIVGVSFLAMLYVFGLVLYIMQGYLRLGRDVGAPLLRRGWRSASAALLSRRYRGSIGGRRVEVLCHPPEGPWAGTFEVHVGATTAQHVTIGHGPLRGAAGLPQMVVPLDSGQIALAASDDLLATQRLLDDPRAKAPILSLLVASKNRQVTISPAGLVLTVRYRGRLDDLVAELLHQQSPLVALAEAAEWALSAL